jgi:hypothetical protein
VLVGLILTASVAIVGMVAYVVRASRRVEEPSFHYCRCPGCGQKVRYAASRAGRQAGCPRCPRQWALPATSEPLAKAELAGASPWPRRGIVLRRSA